MNVDNFWRALNQWKSIIQYGRTHSEFCGRCFEPVCDCGAETVTYQDALDEITFWADINIMEAHLKGTGIVQDNQGYDRDHIYPILPEPIVGQGEGVLTRIPQDILTVAQIVRGSRRWFYDGKFSLMDEESTMPQGITWGIMLEKFHPIARYNYPHWHVFRKGPPYGLPVYITDNVPNHKFRVVYQQ